MLVFTGIASNGKNILFALAFINNELYTTFKWALEAFLQIHQKDPHLMFSDGDLAICKTLDEYSDRFTHLLCQWHFIRNLNRNFSYLKINHLSKYETILKLLYIKDSKQFDKDIKMLQDFFSSDENSKSYRKSLNYLKDIHSFRVKWADCYKPTLFTVGITTTSRAESMNHVIKTYMNQSRELSAMIELEIQLDNSHAFQDPLEKIPRATKSMYQMDPVMINIKEELGEILYKRHFRKYLEHSQYSIRKGHFKK